MYVQKVTAIKGVLNMDKDECPGCIGLFRHHQARRAEPAKGFIKLAKELEPGNGCNRLATLLFGGDASRCRCRCIVEKLTTDNVGHGQDP